MEPRALTLPLVLTISPRIADMSDDLPKKLDSLSSKYIKEGSAMSDVTFHFSKGRKKSWREL
jgi:hypothetical protein